MSDQLRGYKAHLCVVCQAKPFWRILREGDAVVTWACTAHLDKVAWMTIRDNDTRLIITVVNSELAASRRTLDWVYANDPDKADAEVLERLASNTPKTEEGGE